MKCPRLQTRKRPTNAAIMRCYRLHLGRTSPRGNGLIPRDQSVGFQKWVQISGWSESDLILSIMRKYSPSSPCPGIDGPLSTVFMSKSNSRGFPEDMCMISSHIPTQSSARHPPNLPKMEKSKKRFVSALDAGIVPRTTLISLSEAHLGLIMAFRANTRRRGSPLRFTSPARGSCSPCC